MIVPADHAHRHETRAASSIPAAFRVVPDREPGRHQPPNDRDQSVVESVTEHTSFVFATVLPASVKERTRIASRSVSNSRLISVSSVENGDRVGQPSPDTNTSISNHTTEQRGVWTVAGRECIVGEAAAPEGGGFVSISGNSLSSRHKFTSEAGDLCHGQHGPPAPTPLI